jgi:predicted nucleotide-binding protein (sugar kinase/HSP70/actin superfamily)
VGGQVNFFKKLREILEKFTQIPYQNKQKNAKIQFTHTKFFAQGCEGIG